MRRVDVDAIIPACDCWSRIRKHDFGRTTFLLHPQNGIRIDFHGNLEFARAHELSLQGMATAHRGAVCETLLYVLARFRLTPCREPGEHRALWLEFYGETAFPLRVEQIGITLRRIFFPHKLSVICNRRQPEAIR